MVVAEFDSSGYLTFNPSKIDLKKINFFYGKNGTGKSTISRLLRLQFSEKYTVKMFSGFSGIVGISESLDSIALGEQNVKVQQEIDHIDEELRSLFDEISERVGKENLYSRREQIKKSLSDSKQIIDRICVNSARKIKNLSHPQVAGTSYNKRDFQAEINEGRQLSDLEFEQSKRECISDLMNIPDRISFPVCDFRSIRIRANELLSVSVSQCVYVPGIGDNSEKRNFAEQGMGLHLRKDGELCAFCGSEITKERWKLLDQLFNKSVSELKKQIKSLIEEISELKETLISCGQIDSRLYYSFIQEKVRLFGERYICEKELLVRSLDEVLDLLREKLDNIFSAVDVYKGTDPSWDASSLQLDFDQIYEENIEYGENLSQRQQSAKKRLRLHYVSKMLEDTTYRVEEANCRSYDSQLAEIEFRIKEKENKGAK